MYQKTLSLRIFGFIASFILTVAAFLIIIHPGLFHLENRAAIVIILSLALLQFIIQSIFFLDLGRETGPQWILAFFISTLFIILIIVFFSIWIMDHLNYNMMPMS
ncbi:MAG: cytochrome C oxidase subunit IV family protein [Oligoflexia bacterium]|nr:cytochrome C oxidase subunit IV family protein [Oligoflexia bacterium]